MSSTRKSLVVFLAASAMLTAVLYSYNISSDGLRATLTVNEYKGLPNDEPVRATAGASARRAELQPSYEVIGAFLNGRVTNNGSKQIKQVTLRIPDAAYACVRLKPGDSRCQASAGLVTIGDLGSFESADVQIWLSYRPNVTAYKDIKLTHSEGVGRIHFGTVQVPATFLRTYYLTLGLASALMLYALYVYFSQRHADQEVARAYRRQETARGKT